MTQQGSIGRLLAELPLGPGHLLEAVNDRLLSMFLSGIGVGSTFRPAESPSEDKKETPAPVPRIIRAQISVADRDGLVERILDHASDHGPIDRFN